jgi:hypothetical protein
MLDEASGVHPVASVLNDGLGARLIRAIRYYLDAFDA